MADLDIALDHLLHLLLQADLCIVHSYKVTVKAGSGWTDMGQ